MDRTSQRTKDKEPVKKIFTKDEWVQKMQQVSLSKKEMNQLVMNYLVIEGYKDAAIQFQQEGNCSGDASMLSQIDSRTAIRNLIQNGRVQEAIELTNELDPEILDTNPKLFFHLQLQQLIELIRSNAPVEQILEYAQDECVPRALEHKLFLEDLEQVMTLLALPDISQHALLQMSQRHKVASELNAALLASQSLEKEARLGSLLKMCSYVEDKLLNPTAKDVQPIVVPTLKEVINL